MHFIPIITLALAFSGSTAYAETNKGSVEFQPCRIGIAPMSVSAECAEVPVSFTHGLSVTNHEGVQKPGGVQKKESPETLTLSIAKIPARSNQPAIDPVTLLAGGPGQAATDSWSQIQAAFYPILANRDVYLIDQRGTGDSARMNCETPPEDGMSIDLDVVRLNAQQCYDEQSHATEWFTTSVAVRDLDAVRQALNIDQWNLYGVSYGTRVAQHYLRRYPQHTRSVILDAVVAPERPLGPEIPLHAQQSLNALFERCNENEGCTQAFPQLESKTNALFDALKSKPRTVQFENVTRGTLESMEFSVEHLASTVRLLSYSSYGTAILPSMLYDAANNNNLAPFARQANILTSQLGDSLAAGMHATVFCTEDAPRISVTDKAALQKTYLGDSLIDTTVANCEPWPVGVVDDDFFEPVVSDVPVLALSGAIDPITPPAYAELAIQSLSNSLHLVNEHQGHTQAPLGCMPTIMSQFIESADPSSLQVDCLERLSPPALFVDANGPLP